MGAARVAEASGASASKIGVLGIDFTDGALAGEFLNLCRDVMNYAGWCPVAE